MFSPPYRLTSQALVQHLDCRSDETPTSPTYVSSGTTRPDLVIIRHIDIKDELSKFWAKDMLGNGFTVSWLRDE